MKLFALEMWRTWREERLIYALLGLGLSLFAGLLFATGWLGPSDPLNAQILAGAGFVLATLLLGDGSSGSSERRQRLTLIARLPSGLGQAFLARFCCFLLGVLACSALGVALACLGAHVSGFSATTLWSAQPWALLVATGLVLGSAAFAASIWLPKSALGLPAGFLALICALVPFAIAESLPLFFGLSIPLHLGLGLALLTLTAGSAAWRGYLFASFPEGHGHGAWMRTLAAVFFPLVLLWSPCVFGAIGPPVWSNSGQYMQLEDASYDESTGQVITLARWSRIAGPLDALAPSAPSGMNLLDRRLLRPVQRWLQKRAVLSVNLATGAAQRVSAEPTLEVLNSFQSAMQGSLLLKSLQASTAESGELPTDTLRLHCTTQSLEDSVGTTIVLPSSQPSFNLPSSEGEEPISARIVRRAGVGFLIEIGDRHAYFDPSRRLLVEVRRFKESLALAADVQVFVRPGPWLLYDHRMRSWFLSEPEVPALRACSTLATGDKAVGILRDGRLLVLRAENLMLVDEDLGEATQLEVQGALTGPVHSAHAAWGNPGEPIDASDLAVLYVFADNWTGLARLDPLTFTLVPAADRGGRIQRLLTCPDNDHAIVQEERCIARLTFGSPEREILFPRELASANRF